MQFIFGMFVGSLIGFVAFMLYMIFEWKRNSTPLPPLLRRSYPRRSTRPDLRRVVLRPVNKDQPPSRVTQALIRRRPTRKLDEDD